MEKSTIHKLKAKAGQFFEPQFLQTGRVLEVRLWQPATLIEIDLHLPIADMAQWADVPYIKFKVAGFTYRDYTPACWDTETHTCTIFVDAAHIGPGANWARHLQKGDTIQYLKIGTSHQQPNNTTAIIGLGDESSMGQLLALQQMVMPATRFSGAILLSDDEHCGLFGQYFRSPVKAIKRNDVFGHHTLIQWVIEQQYALQNTVFYITGNQIMVSQLGKMLKLQGYNTDQVKVKGFWK